MLIHVWSVDFECCISGFEIQNFKSKLSIRSVSIYKYILNCCVGTSFKCTSHKSIELMTVFCSYDNVLGCFWDFCPSISACANAGSGSSGLPFELWCRYYHPNVRDQCMAKVRYSNCHIHSNLICRHLKSCYQVK